MNPKKALAALFVSNTRRRLLAEFFARPREPFYIRELTKRIKGTINAVRRELLKLEETGLLRSEQRGNRSFFALNYRHPLFYPLLLLMERSYGLGEQIQNRRDRLGNIRLVLASNQFLAWSAAAEGVDLIIVGRVVLSELGEIIRHEEKRRGREINYAVMSWREFRLRYHNGDPFLVNFLLRGVAVLVGNEEFIFREK